MIAALLLIFAFFGLRALLGHRDAGLATSVGRGIGRVFLTTLTLGVTMSVILGTAWFMIPGAEWKPTADFAKAQGRKAAEAAASQFKSYFKRAAPSP
jgi:hypothetical protein